jgi:hypothetical protein
MTTRVGVIAACFGMLFALPGLVSAQVPGGVRCVAEPTDQFVTFGDLIECDITPPGDVDLFRLKLTDGQTTHIQLTGPPTGSSIGCLELRRPDGTQKYFACLQSVPLTWTAVGGGVDPPGVWTIKVSEMNNDGAVPYSLQIECLSSDTCAVPSDVVCDVQLNQTTYVDSDMVIANVLRFANNRPGPVATEIKLWLGVPGLAPVSLVNTGSNGSVMLPSGFDHNFGPLPLFPVAPALPRGTYELSCRILDPTTGRILSEDLNPFVIQ